MTKKVASKKIETKSQTIESLLELIRITSTVIPDDVAKTLMKARAVEDKSTTASYAMDIIKDNIELAKFKSQPLCQDTGTVIFFYLSSPRILSKSI